MLESWTPRRSSAQALALRARIVLMAAEGLWSNGEIAEALGVSRPTVTPSCDRHPVLYLAHQLIGHQDAAQPMLPRNQGLMSSGQRDAPRTTRHLKIEKLRRHGGLAVRRQLHSIYGDELLYPFQVLLQPFLT